MKLARAVERRLERMLDGVAGSVFGGTVHPTEIVQRMVREADLQSTDHPTGTLVPNSAIVSLNPADLDLPPASLSRVLAAAYEAHAAEEGWRLAGPSLVRVKLDDSVRTGSIECTFERAKGSRHPWGRLTGKVGAFELNNNRLWIGRSGECDVVMPYEEISRHHASVVRSHGTVWVADLGSSNGTAVGGTRVGKEPVEFRPGSVIRLADKTFKLEIV